MRLYSLEYLFGQFGSGVRAVSLPKLLLTPSLLRQRQSGEKEKPDTVQALFNKSQHTGVLSTLFQPQIQNTAPQGLQ